MVEGCGGKRLILLPGVEGCGESCVSFDCGCDDSEEYGIGEVTFDITESEILKGVGRVVTLLSGVEGRECFGSGRYFQWEMNIISIFVRNK